MKHGRNLQDMSWGESAREIVSKPKEVAPESGELFKSYFVVVVAVVVQLFLSTGLPWSVVNSPSVSPLEKTDLPFPTRYQLQAVSWLAVQLSAHFPFCAWILSGFTCAGLVRAATVFVSSYVHLSVVSRKHFLCVL